MSCPDHNAFHPRKGKPAARRRRKETGLVGDYHPDGCSAEGTERGEVPVRPATYGVMMMHEVVP